MVGMKRRPVFGGQYQGAGKIPVLIKGEFSQVSRGYNTSISPDPIRALCGLRFARPDEKLGQIRKKVGLLFWESCVSGPDWLNSGLFGLQTWTLTAPIEGRIVVRMG